MILLLWSESSNAVVVACRHAFDYNGKRWGGSEKGRRIKVTTEQAQNIRRLKDEGEKITSKPSLTSVLMVRRVSADTIQHSVRSCVSVSNALFVVYIPIFIFRQSTA